MMMTEEENQVQIQNMKKKMFVVVVGMNRPRLAKIMDLVYDYNDGDGDGDGDGEKAAAATSSSTPLDPSMMVEYVPCVAKIDSYEDPNEDGKTKRYLADLTYVCCHDDSHHLDQHQDGSNNSNSNSTYKNKKSPPPPSSTTTTLTTFLDDDEFRSNLRAVLLVGYDWKEPPNDQQLIQNYFENIFSLMKHNSGSTSTSSTSNAANTELDSDDDENDGDANHAKKSSSSFVVTCVEPNRPQFDTLQDEMKYFKNLSDDEKEQFSVRQKILGPGKMAKFVLETIKTSTTTTTNILPDGGDKGHSDDPIGVESSSSSSSSSVMVHGPTAENDTTLKKSREQQDDNHLHHQQDIPKVPQIDSNEAKTMFACRICRTLLFGDNQLASEHVPNLHTFHHKHSSSLSSTTTTCTSIFCDESVLEWLGEHGSMIEGKLKCPKCSFKLGHWNWSGGQCSCGTWVCPSIQIPTSKVDVIQR